MIGIIVEGKSDKEAISEICKKFGVSPKIRLMKGNDFRKAKSFASLLKRGGCQKIILLKDCHRSSPSEIKEKFRKYNLQGKIELCIVQNAIETWFLADSSAISDYLRIKVEEIVEPEKIMEPDEYLDKIFKRAGKKEYFKGGKDPKELAKRLSIEKLRKKCSSFRIFEKILQ